MPTAPVVLKLGGSLLSLPDLHRRLDRVLQRYCSSSLLLVVGGGAAADLVREWDRVHQLGDETAHRLALEAMTLNGHCLSALLNRTAIVKHPAECDSCWERNRLPIIHAASFVPALETEYGERLSRTWDVTSDSISAWIAGRIAADRLVLLKSVDAPEADALEACDDVDPGFSTMCRHIRYVEWINLRADSLVPCGINHPVECQ